MTDIMPDWVHLGTLENGIAVNQYFVDNPDMILGEMKTVSGPFGPTPTCMPYEDSDLSEQLNDAIQNIHATITEYEMNDVSNEEEETIPADPEVRNFSFTLVDGNVYFRENSIMRKIELNATAQNRIKGMIAIRDCVRKLIEYQTEGYSDYAIKQQQEVLNKLYDDFTKKYGLINSRGNSMAFSDDSSYFLLCSLEVINENIYYGAFHAVENVTMSIHKNAITALIGAEQMLTVHIKIPGICALCVRKYRLCQHTVFMGKDRNTVIAPVGYIDLVPHYPDRCSIAFHRAIFRQRRNCIQQGKLALIIAQYADRGGQFIDAECILSIFRPRQMAAAMSCRHRNLIPQGQIGIVNKDRVRSQIHCQQEFSVRCHAHEMCMGGLLPCGVRAISGMLADDSLRQHNNTTGNIICHINPILRHRHMASHATAGVDNFAGF